MCARLTEALVARTRSTSWRTRSHRSRTALRAPSASRARTRSKIASSSPGGLETSGGDQRDHAQDPLELVEHVDDRLAEAVVGAGVGDDRLELHRGAHGGVPVDLARGARVGHLAQLLEPLDGGALDPAAGGDGRGLAGQQRPQAAEVIGVLERDRADDVPRPRERVHEPVAPQSRERLAHGRLADAPLLSQRRLGEAAARRERQVDDLAPDRPVGLVGAVEAGLVLIDQQSCGNVAHGAGHRMDRRAHPRSMPNESY
jgi:hypothetical protein